MSGCFRRLVFTHESRVYQLVYHGPRHVPLWIRTATTDSLGEPHSSLCREERLSKPVSDTSGVSISGGLGWLSFFCWSRTVSGHYDTFITSTDDSFIPWTFLLHIVEP